LARTLPGASLNQESARDTLKGESSWILAVGRSRPGRDKTGRRHHRITASLLRRGRLIHIPLKRLLYQYRRFFVFNLSLIFIIIIMEDII
jgi:hypothetical protein